MRPRILLFALIAALWVAGPFSCIAPRSNPDPAGLSPAGSGPYWERSDPEEQGIDSRSLADVLEAVRDEKLDVHSILLIRNGRLVLESYIHPYTRTDLHNVKSVSKSILSALVGIALHDGVLDDLDRPVADYFPQYFTVGDDPRKREITLRHLMTMTSGLDLDENGPRMGKIFRSDDWIRTTFEAPMAADPGTTFTYTTPLTHTMSGILTEAAGMSLHDYAGEHLFGPLGIDRLQWQQGPKGYYFGGAELWLTPDAMARFGYLFLRNGRWEERQLVPAEWVAESTRDQLNGAGGNRRYGYWWWLSDAGLYTAMGWGGQGIAVVPERDTVIVVTAADHAVRDRIAREILTGAFRSEGEPLPPDPEGVERLERTVAELQDPEPLYVPEHPAVAKEISGKRFVLTGDPRFRSVTFEFEQEGRAWISIERTEGSGRLEVGLDGLYRLTDSGEMGNMPRDNRMACRGSWTADDTFAFEVHEMGNPLVSAATAVFGDDGLDLDVLIRPVGYTISLKGTVPE